jgi:3-methylcrotonyl-CoA carboxylase alpha subunit
LVNPDFTAGEVDTGFIEAHHDDIVFELAPPDWLLTLAAEPLINRDVPSSAGFRLNAAAQTQTWLSDREQTFRTDLAMPVSDDQRNYALLHEDGDATFVTMQGATWRFAPARAEGGVRDPASSGAILSPMPGRIIAVEVSEGQAVTRGQKLVTLEAMKMEHSLTAPFDGTVSELKVTQGDQVQLEALLVRIEPAPEM